MNNYKENLFLYLSNKLPRIGKSNSLRSRFIALSGATIGKNVTIYNNIEIAPIGGAKNLSIGDETFINSGVRFQCPDGGEIIIGKNVLIGPRCQFETVNHTQLNSTNKRGNIYKPIVIEDNVWIGAKSIILPGVTIGKGSVIASGAVVAKSIPENVLAGGVPAKIIKKYL